MPALMKRLKSLLGKSIKIVGEINMFLGMWCLFVFLLYHNEYNFLQYKHLLYSFFLVFGSGMILKLWGDILLKRKLSLVQT